MLHLQISCRVSYRNGMLPVSIHTMLPVTAISLSLALTGFSSTTQLKVAGDLHKLRADTMPAMIQDNDAVSPPPPLPPRTRVNSTPPPPLPPRDSQANSLSRTSTQYQPVKRNNNPTSTRAGVQALSGPAAGLVAAGSSPAAPPSSLEQLAEQTGFTTQQIQEILMHHSARQRQQTPLSGAQADAAAAITAISNSIEQYQSAAGGYHPQFTIHHSQSPPGPPPSGPPPSGPPPPQYSSAHTITTAPPPPPPYSTPHQPSPASSVTSGSSNDYLHMPYGYFPTTGEYRTPAYGESPSSGELSPPPPSVPCR